MRHEDGHVVNHNDDYHNDESPFKNNFCAVILTKDVCVGLDGNLTDKPQLTAESGGHCRLVVVFNSLEISNDWQYDKFCVDLKLFDSLQNLCVS